jgi:uncharacterized coiled-coil protein SlyX
MIEDKQEFIIHQLEVWIENLITRLAVQKMTIADLQEQIKELMKKLRGEGE